jgi:acyl-ACP thioesterase
VPVPAGEPAGSMTMAVRRADLDPLDHVNNAVYLDWLTEALDAIGLSAPSGTVDRAIRLEYLASAEHGDEVTVELFGTPGAWTARIRRASGGELLRAEGRGTA